MEQGKRRNFLIAIAGVAVIIAVVALVWLPKIPSQDVSGAIGAVEKHHETQISSKDVILGDESVRLTSKLIFIDYLNDAAKLQSFSATLGTVHTFNKEQLQSIAHDLESHQTELQNHFQSNMQDALNAVTQLLNKEGSTLGAKDLANVTAELQSIETALSNKNLESAEIESLANQFAHITSELESHDMLADVSDLASMQTELSSAVAEVQNKSTLDDKGVLNAANRLGNVAQDLSNRDLLGVLFADRAEYLQSIAVQSKSLDNVESALNAIVMSRVENQAELQSKLQSMAESLAHQASNLESQTLENMEEQLSDETQMASMIHNMDQMVASVSKLDNKSLDNVTYASFTEALGNVDKNLDSFSAELQSHAVANMQAELGSISEHLNQAAELQSKLNNEGGLNVRIGGNSGAGGRFGVHVFNKDTLASFGTFLGSLSQALESNAFASKLQNNQELANKANELQSKSADLQAHVTEF